MRSICILLLGLVLVLALAPAPATIAEAQPAAGTPALGTNIERIGHVGGQTNRVATQGLYAYLGRGSDLVVVDISVPSRPQPIGKLALPDQVGDIALAGTRAYVAANRAGLRIVDIQNPAAPTELGAYVAPDAAASVAIAGNRAFLATQRTINTGYPPVGASRLYTLDISNPAAPKVVVTVEKDGYLGDLKSDGQFLFATIHQPNIFSAASSLLVFDISGTGAPAPAGSLYVGGYPAGLTIDGQRAYFPWSDRLSKGMTVIDLSNPREPALLGTFSAGISNPGEPVANGNIVYLPSSRGMFIVNVADPQNPSQINLFPQIPFGALSRNGDLLAMADEHGFFTVDIANASAPKVVGTYALFGSAGALTLDGQIAYIASNERVWAIEISTPANPRELGYLDQPALQIVVRNNYLYLASGELGLQIADFRNPASPRVVGRYVPSGSVSGVVLNGNMAYLAHSGGMKIVDISNPTRPRLIADRPDLMLNGQMQLVGTRLYALAYVAQVALLILDAADAARPRLLGRYDGAYDLLGVDGTSVYVNDAQNNLLRLDASTPSAPIVSTNYGLANVIKRAVIGRYLYGSAYYEGTRVFDIGTPSRVREVASDPTIYASDLVGTNGLLYVADILRGLHIVRLRLAIRGYITDPNGAPAAGVAVSAGGASAQTDATGAYTITNLLSGTLTLAPAQAGFRFTQEALNTTLGADLDGQNFTRLPAPVSAGVTPGQAATLGYTDAQGRRTELAIPGTALTQNTMLTLTPISVGFAAGMASAAHAFTISAAPGSPAAFAAPLVASIEYSDIDIRAISDEAALVLQWWDGTAWRAPDCPGSIMHDLQQRRITAPICRTGAYQLAGPAHQVLLPLVTLEESRAVQPQ